MKGRDTLFSSARTNLGRDDWMTPPNVLQCVRDTFGKGIYLDPCADADPCNHFALHNFSGPSGNGKDGLSLDWSEDNVFINPPYATFIAWATKLESEFNRASFKQAIMLVPSRTDTKAWSIATRSATAVCFVRRRLKFVGAPNSAPFPSALIYLGDYPGVFAQAMRDLGPSWKPLSVGL